jgi:hypothetical protein
VSHLERRPDLRAALGWSATELGSMLFDSLHTKLLTLPDESLVYPAHGAGPVAPLFSVNSYMDCPIDFIQS